MRHRADATTELAESESLSGDIRDQNQPSRTLRLEPRAPTAAHPCGARDLADLGGVRAVVALRLLLILKKASARSERNFAHTTSEVVCEC